MVQKNYFPILPMQNYIFIAGTIKLTCRKAKKATIQGIYTHTVWYVSKVKGK